MNDLWIALALTVINIALIPIGIWNFRRSRAIHRESEAILAEAAAHAEEARAWLAEMQARLAVLKAQEGARHGG